MKFEYYVLKYDWNKKSVILYNIFNNIEVQEASEKAVKKYLRSPSKYCYHHIHDDVVYGFDALCKEIDRIIKWQEWARREYEISVCDAFETDITKLEKWDCYKQCKNNIPMITREIIYQYKDNHKYKRK